MSGRGCVRRGLGLDEKAASHLGIDKIKVVWPDMNSLGTRGSSSPKDFIQRGNSPNYVILLICGVCGGEVAGDSVTSEG